MVQDLPQTNLMFLARMEKMLKRINNSHTKTQCIQFPSQRSVGRTVEMGKESQLIGYGITADWL
jgi:hypothetical protein